MDKLDVFQGLHKLLSTVYNKEENDNDKLYKGLSQKWLGKLSAIIFVFHHNVGVLLMVWNRRNGYINKRFARSGYKK